MPETLPLLRVCALLNAAGARYLIAGGYACILHGIVRTTEDVDLLIEPTEENCARGPWFQGNGRIEAGCWSRWNQ